MTDFVFEEKSLYIGIPLEARVVAELSQKKLTLFTAESCTGGLVSKLITDISGASRVLLGGIVSYTNEVKMNQLGVSP
ncbi:MAG: CinA family protein, partial [Clostridia bacterium]|nr:CinA family protein [Clostridia bacterium]